MFRFRYCHVGEFDLSTSKIDNKPFTVKFHYYQIKGNTTPVHNNNNK